MTESTIDSTATTETLVEQYFSAWNEPDAARRLALAEKVWTDDGRYVDPLSDVRGPAGFSDMIAAVQQQAPGHTVRLVSRIEQHHDQVRFVWQLVAPDGSVAITGIDVCEVTDDGKFLSVAGFFGTIPEEDAA